MRGNALFLAQFQFSCDDQFNLSRDPEKAREFHHESIPKDTHSSAHFCSTYGPQFCFMEITQNLREYAPVTAWKRLAIGEGMAEKAAEFRELGRDVFRPA